MIDKTKKKKRGLQASPELVEAVFNILKVDTKKQKNRITRLSNKDIADLLNKTQQTIGYCINNLNLAGRIIPFYSVGKRIGWLISRKRTRRRIQNTDTVFKKEDKKKQKIEEKPYKPCQIDIGRMLNHFKIQHTHYFVAGRLEYKCFCPFHTDSIPSFQMNGRGGYWHCFGCGASGSLTNFVRRIKKYKKNETAIKYIKNMRIYWKATAKSPINDSDETQEKKPIKLPICDSAIKHLDIVGKRVSKPVAEKYRMLYCSNTKDKIHYGRLVIPINMNGRFLSYCSRDMLGRYEIWEKRKQELITKNLSRKELEGISLKEDFPKYMYPPNSPNKWLIFNWDNAIQHRSVVVTEGILDAIRLIEWRFNAVSVLSSVVTNDKIRLLANQFEKIFIAFDGDEAGRKGAQSVMARLHKNTEVFNIVITAGKDPDSCKKEEFGKCFSNATKYEPAKRKFDIANI